MHIKFFSFSAFLSQPFCRRQKYSLVHIEKQHLTVFIISDDLYILFRNDTAAVRVDINLLS